MPEATSKLTPPITPEPTLNTRLGSAPPLMMDEGNDGTEAQTPPTLQQTMGEPEGETSPSERLQDQMQRETGAMFQDARQQAKMAGLNQLSAEAGKGREELNPVEKEIMDKVRSWALKQPYLGAIIIFLKPIYDILGEPWFGIILCVYLTGSAFAGMTIMLLTPIIAWILASLICVPFGILFWYMFYSDRLEKYVKALFDIKLSPTGSSAPKTAGQATMFRT